VSALSRVLSDIAGGDRQAAVRLLPLVYDEFRALAMRHLARERPGHTLQPTALVHEAYLKLVDQSRVNWRGRTHFFAIGAQAMRRILVEHARSRKRQKRGGGAQRVLLEEAVALVEQNPADVLALDEALVKLASLDERQALVVEYRFFGGLGMEEIAEVLGVSKRTVEGEWRLARAWLHRELSDGRADVRPAGREESPDKAEQGGAA
jgi:RNA polymerase sigma-70 factor (ECF subfamily)